MKEKNKGITLIALIITIVVMLILVGVSVSILINSNLIGAAEKTATAYNQATQKEATLEGLTVNNKTLTEYVNATKRKINFKIDSNTYEAYEGETWAEWVERCYPDGAEGLLDTVPRIVDTYYSGSWTSVAMNELEGSYRRYFCYRVSSNSYRKPQYSDSIIEGTNYFWHSYQM